MRLSSCPITVWIRSIGFCGEIAPGIRRRPNVVWGLRPAKKPGVMIRVNGDGCEGGVLSSFRHICGVGTWIGTEFDVICAEVSSNDCLSGACYLIG